MSDEPVPPESDDSLGPSYLIIGLDGFDAQEYLPRLIWDCREVHTRNAATKQPCRCGRVHPTDMAVDTLILVGTGHHDLPIDGPRLLVQLLPSGVHKTISRATTIVYNGDPDTFTLWVGNALCLLVAPITVPGLLCLGYENVVGVLQSGKTGVCGTHQDTVWRQGGVAQSLRSFSDGVGGRTKASMCFIVGGLEMTLIEVNEVCGEFIEAVNQLGVPEDAAIEDRDFLFASTIDDHLPDNAICVYMLLVL